MKKQIRFYLSFIFISFSVFAQDIVSIPELKTRVTDMTNTLSPQEAKELNSRLKSFEESGGSQVAILIIPTTGDETIEQFSIRVVDEWKLGRADVDDGVLFLVAMNDRKMRVEVGYGLEGALTDALSKRIITNVVTPEFRSGHFYQGISDGLDVILSAIKGEELPPAVTQEPTRRTSSKSWFLPLLILGFIGSGFLKVLLTKKLGKGKATGISALLVFIIGWVFAGLFAAIFISIIVSIFMSIPSNGGRGGRGGGFYGGYGGGFGGSGGFGGGGFSGGGGGFGGGGASGGW